MPSLETILAVMAAGFTLSASPGPSMLYVLSRTIQQGRRGGIASSLGLALGGLLLAVVAAYGLAALAAGSPMTLRVIRYGGAAYLCWLGLQALRAACTPTPARTQAAAAYAAVPTLRLFAQGVLVELTNPKTLLFFLAFMTPFAANHSPLGLLLLGALIPLTAVPADLLCIFAGAWVAAKARRRTWLARACDLAAALVLLALGVAVLLL